MCQTNRPHDSAISYRVVKALLQLIYLPYRFFFYGKDNIKMCTQLTQSAYYSIIGGEDREMVRNHSDDSYFCEGVTHMTATVFNLNASEKVIGARELRRSLADVLDNVINSYQIITTGNRVRGGKTASIISTDLLEELLNCYKFNPSITFDNSTKQYIVEIKEIEISGIGDTQEEAIDIAADSVEMMTENFFEEAETYMRFGKYRKMYPYFLKVTYAQNREQLLEVLNLAK
jgi:hypothetical protein